MYVRIPRPALPAASALAAVCAVAVGTPGRVGVGVPERAVISGRNPLPRGAGQGALSVCLICCATIAVACSLVITGRSAATGSSRPAPHPRVVGASSRSRRPA